MPPSASLSLSTSSSCLHATPLHCQVRFVIVPMQLKAYGDAFSPSTGDRSDHLAGHLVLQKATTLKRAGKRVKTTTVDRFEDMLLPREVRAAVEAMGITVPSPIQQTAIEACLQKKDVLLAAPNGEGKTVAFLAPLYANMLKDRDVYKIPLRERRPRTIILAPTRELVDQLHGVCKRFDALTGLHSESFTSRKRAAYHISRLLKQKKMDVLIMHPRVLLKLIRTRRLFLDDIRYVVVDEADIVCSSQHDHDAMHLIAKIQKRNAFKHLWPVQTQFVFSTSMITRKLEYYLAQKFPKLVGCFRPKAMHLPGRTVRQRFYPVQQEAYKMDFLFHLLQRHGHVPEAIETSDDELRVATKFRGFGGGQVVGEAQEQREETVVGPEAADLFSDSVSLSPPCDEEATEAQLVPSSSGEEQRSHTTISIKEHQPIEVVAAAEQLKRRIVHERIRPTAWEHLTTLAAPFTCPIARTVFGDNGDQANNSGGGGNRRAVERQRKRTLIFFRDIDSCTAIYHRLKAAGFFCALVHAALPFSVRKEMFARFASGECDILCTTDVLSRGVDMHVDLVINFHMPSTTVTYLSRIGRVGRMGRVGDVASLFTKQQGIIARAIQTLNKGEIPLHQVSNWRPHMNLPRYQEWRIQKMNAISKSYVSMITRKTIPAHLERTYLRHNATWRPLYHPHTVSKHGGVAPLQQQKIMDRVTRDAVQFRRGVLAKRKGGRAKFGSLRDGVWNTTSGPYSGTVANSEQSSTPGGPGFGVPEGPPR